MCPFNSFKNNMKHFNFTFQYFKIKPRIFWATLLYILLCTLTSPFWWTHTSWQNFSTYLSMHSQHKFSQRKFAGWIFQKLEGIFLESILCLEFISSTILTKPVSARLLGTKNTMFFQAFCVSPLHRRDELGSGISLHLCLYKDNQLKREKLSQSADCFLCRTPNSFGRFSSSLSWLIVCVNKDISKCETEDYRSSINGIVKV